MCYASYGEREKIGLMINDMVRNGELEAPVAIGRDHHDTGSVASPYRETEAMKDGSDAIADWPILNALLTSFFLVIGIIFGIFVMIKVDKFGRKGIQITGCLVMAILFLILPHFYFLAGIIVIVSFLELFNSFGGATVGIFPAEVTITRFRGTSYGFSSMMGKIGAVMGVIAMALLIHGKNYFNAYTFLAVIMVIAILLTLLLPETKNIKLE